MLPSGLAGSGLRRSQAKYHVGVILKQKSPHCGDFYLKCIAAGHSRASCTCIYHRLERQYSPKLMHKLGSLSLQSPEIPHDFVKSIMRTMQKCQS
ncbi:hypothetical protein ITF21_15505 [Acinetobacter baumannii]|nr:hypothetical protein [Acinetobacter baumannii]EKV6895693.1 hypothetical protein [Acinetobacter baumannii]EKW4078836.1 hypothetical protein [Acinetobacter baumannii]MBF8337086.1 hypothetical protein [Acinetobacter baumannii]MBF8342955.1 hypothetical protein [Acinetobacter baumannii]